MRIRSNGNVGIGTNNPATLLQISNSSNPTNTNTGTNTLNLFMNVTQNTDVGPTLGFSGWDNGVSNPANFGAIKGAKENNTASNSNGYLAFFTNPNSVNISERMRITSAGNVGIGTTTPRSANCGVMMLIAYDQCL